MAADNDCPGHCLVDVSKGPREPVKKLKGGMGLYLGHLNILSLRNKVDEHKVHMEGKALDVLALTETWLCDSISKIEVDIPGCVLYCKKRQERNGGGMVMYVCDSLQATVRVDLESPDLEVLWLQLRLMNKNCLVACVYRPLTLHLPFTTILKR